MRKLNLSLLLIFAIALPTYAARGRDQSYITFDDGGTTIKQGDDNRDVEGRVNLPVYPGDEITTNRRGRSEIRLADGNVIALDRSTSIRFQSISNAYEGDAGQSVIELIYGHVGISRNDDSTELLRVDTANASYAAADGSAIYAVDADSRGRERVTVYAGAIEVRTPLRTTRLRRGEEARVDDQGLYGLVNASGNVADEFERWFIRRADRYNGRSSRYLDRSLAYSETDLEENGSWVYMSGYDGWGWRPRVSVGWRPYYHGRWGWGPGGYATWISYEPWGWVPYHYGRWAYDPIQGWLWFPGYTYAPAWVYWAYGPNYIGWAPAGWWDCYRPYYNWAYNPYRRGGDFGFGFYGRVRMNEVDLRPWTFVNPNGLTSTRIDQAALTTDAIRGRLLRGGAGDAMATVTGNPARFTRNELRDPAAAVSNIVRRGTGNGRDAAPDMTSYIRRDTDLAPVVRDRIVRSRPETSGSVGAPSGVPTPGTAGTLEGRVGDRDGTSTRGDNRFGGERLGVDRSKIYRDTYHREETTPSGSTGNVDRGSNTVRRGETPSTDATPSGSTSRGNWRDRVERNPSAPQTPATSTPDRSAGQPPADNNWRGRGAQRGVETPSGREEEPSSVPRRIIDRIGGARVYPGETSTPRESSQPRETSRPRESSQPRETARAERSSPPPSSQREAAPPPPRKESSSNSGGGRVKRN